MNGLGAPGGSHGDHSVARGHARATSTLKAAVGDLRGFVEAAGESRGEAELWLCCLQ